MGGWRVGVWLLTLGTAPAGLAQGRPREGSGSVAVPRSFEVTLVLRSPGAGGQGERVQSLTTDVAVQKDRPGLNQCRARVISQVPVTLQKGPTYLDLGTKLDCNDVRVEGNALAMSIVLETGAVNGMVTTEDEEGRRVEEPVISQRTLSLQARLPLGRPTVIFDSKNLDPAGLKPMPLGGRGVAVEASPERPGLQVEMTARELP